MRYFLFVSLILLTAVSCHQKIYQDKEDIILSQSYRAANLRPHFEKNLYRCVVDGKFALKKFHLSGILYLKNFSDTATRVVFQSEMGNTYFDFGWDRNDSFTVHQIMDQMNKPALIKTLKKDFELLLVKQLQELPSGTFRFNKDTDETFIRFELERGFVYYVTDPERKLIRIENADDKQKVVMMKMSPATAPNSMAERINISHLRAGFTIDLKKITPDDSIE